MTISMIWSSRSVLPSQKGDAHLFHVQKKQTFMIFSDLVILWFWVQGFRGHGTLHFLTWFENLFYGLGPI